ncbi:ABC transporter ATP-binding protein [Salimicrobium flavidum]|nr:ABC transporter ATP-binding protein [Salimicrobium flavidum]
MIIAPEEVPVGVLGPNGSGKSTLLKNIYRTLTPVSGSIRLDGELISTLKNKDLARKIGVVAQDNSLPFDFEVKDIVAMGRSPHKKPWSRDTKEDEIIVENALRHVNMLGMADKSFLHLSGGEKQRVLLARVLAQQTDLLILDEPTNHLDVHHQMKFLDTFKDLGTTVLAAIHDLNLAALYCDRIYLMKNGRIYVSDSPGEVLTAKNLREVYDIEADVRRHPETGKVSITYVPGYTPVKGATMYEA